MIQWNSVEALNCTLRITDAFDSHCCPSLPIPLKCLETVTVLMLNCAENVSIWRVYRLDFPIELEAISWIVSYLAI